MTPEQIKQSELLAAKVEQAYKNADTTFLSGLWNYLQESEQLLISLMSGDQPSDSLPGNIEFGPLLYLINNDLPSSLQWIKSFLQGLGMPASAITTAQWQGWEALVINAPGVVAGDGTLISNATYAQLDPLWALAVMSYIYHYSGLGTFANFPNTPSNITISNQTQLTVAVMGDWGTGTSYLDGSYPSPANLVAQGIASLKPDITLHLGDVYYGGTGNEETTNLLPSFPVGSQYSFTLNSNHEMYDGANGYFGTALTNSIFTKQNGCSYFVVNFQDWVIIGLDSAFYDESLFVMQGALNSTQQAFVQGLNISDTQKVIIFTHHTAITTDGSAINNATSNSNLFNAVYTALNNRYPDFWYYGHTHNGIVYNDNSVTQNYTTVFNQHPQIRCMGQGAIPFGNGYDLYTGTGTMINAVDYYAHTPLPNPGTLQTNRVLNGFALLTFSTGKIIENVYEVAPGPNGTAITNLIWTKTTTL